MVDNKERKVIDLNTFRRDKFEEEIETLRTRAGSLTVAGKYIDAVNMFRELLDKDPTDEGALMSAGGILYSHIKDLEAALTFFKRALYLNNKSASAAFMVGKTYLKLGIVDRGTAALQLAQLNGHARAQEVLLNNQDVLEPKE